ncbi:unnamed protein product [Thlaspi arvense]|uniref:MADS-box domain-containing protein n=1 Tax=Thlaspi arvense TaxID=13288 RepID=A0AAU9RB75_THLAR|nr:unnamed protein product [Thlaspi arvense]
MENMRETSSIAFLTPKDQPQTPNALVGQSKKELSAKPTKTSRGRQKIEIKEIDVVSKRHVTFSKRRRGLFKKAAELSVLTGAKIAVITFSQCGRIYSFGHVDTLIDKYVRKMPVNLESYRGDDETEEQGDPWWVRPVESVPEEDLEEYVASLSKLRENLGQRIIEMSNMDRTVEVVPSWPLNMMGWKPTMDMQSMENMTDGTSRIRIGQNG